MTSAPNAPTLSPEQMDDLARRVAAIQSRRDHGANPMTVTLAGALFAGMFALVGWTALETQANSKAIVALQKDIAALQQDVAVLKAGQAELKAGLAELKDGLAKLQDGQEAIARRLDRTTR